MFELATERRQTWDFGVVPADLKKAAQAKVRFHRQRERHWVTERAKTEKALKSRGIAVEDLAVTGGYMQQARVDPKMMQKVSQAVAKVQEHRTKGQEYSRWVSFLTGWAKGVELRVTIADAIYFGLIR